MTIPAPVSLVPFGAHGVEGGAIVAQSCTAPLWVFASSDAGLINSSGKRWTDCACSSRDHLYKEEGMVLDTDLFFKFVDFFFWKLTLILLYSHAPALLDF